MVPLVNKKNMLRGRAKSGIIINKKNKKKANEQTHKHKRAHTHTHTHTQNLEDMRQNK